MKLYYGRTEKCGGIIIDSTHTRILCVLNRQSHAKGEKKWGLPKGHRNMGESIIPCAQREIHEETGLHFERSEFIRSYTLYTNLYYILHLTQEVETFQANDSNEICKVEWKTLSELQHLNTNRDLKHFIHLFQEIPLRGVATGGCDPPRRNYWSRGCDRKDRRLQRHGSERDYPARRNSWSRGCDRGLRPPTPQFWVAGLRQGVATPHAAILGRGVATWGVATGGCDPPTPQF